MKQLMIQSASAASSPNKYLDRVKYNILSIIYCHAWVYQALIIVTFL